MKLFGIQLVPEGWRWPRLVSHVIDSDSKTETLGFLIFFAATYGAFFVAEIGDGGRKIHVLDADKWLWSMFISSTLIGGKMVSKAILDGLATKMNGGKVPAAEPEKEVAAHAPAAAVAQ